MYFEKIPHIPYPVGNNFVVLKDITLNIRFRKEIIEDSNLYAEYDIEDGETPEVIAEKLYGDAHLYWVIMLFNQRYHYINDFPKSDNDLLEFTQKKYGSGNEHEQHLIFGAPHFESAKGYVVDATHPGSHSVSNYDYEFSINEGKRRIKIIDPQLVDQLVREAEELLNA